MKKSKELSDLKQVLHTRFLKLKRRMRKAGMPIVEIETGRTIERQAYYFETGASKTMESNHLTGDAVDIMFVTAPHWEGANSERMKVLEENCIAVGLINGGIMWGWDEQHIEIDPQFIAPEVDSTSILISTAILMIEDGLQSNDSEYSQRIIEKAVDALERLIEIDFIPERSITLWQRFSNIFKK